MTIEVRPFTGTGAEWDELGARFPGWTAMHRWAWKSVIEDALGHETFYWEAMGPEGREGILPLVRVRSALFGHYLVSMPFLNYGGPLGSDRAVQALAKAATDRATADRAKLLELRCRTEAPLDLTRSTRKITVVMELPATHAELMTRFPAKLRSQVRRPEKEGIVTRFGPDQVAPFYEVFRRHMHWLGTPAMPRRFFEALPAAFGEDVWFGCSYLGDRPIACGAGFRWGDEFEITWASALVEFNKVAANMGLYWAFMKRAIDEGLRVFNFGRCSPDSGTHRFKRQWGSTDEALSWYQHSANGAASTPSPSSGPYSFGPKVWTRLPAALVDFAGPRLARLIP